MSNINLSVQLELKCNSYCITVQYTAHTELAIHRLPEETAHMHKNKKRNNLLNILHNVEPKMMALQRCHVLHYPSTVVAPLLPTSYEQTSSA